MLPDSSAAEFTTKLQRHFAQFGRATVAVDTLTLSENPKDMVASLQLLINVDTSELFADILAAVHAREAEVARVEEALAFATEAQQREFPIVLRRAQTTAQVWQEARWWCEQQGAGMMRHMLLVMGRRLARVGLLSRSADVFCLSLEEVMSLLRSLVDSGPINRAATHTAVAQRKRVHQTLPALLR
jgi:hypothetical protein